MYNLGEQFNFDYSKSIANEANVIKGETYRFTILSERLIRLEYNQDGIFEDRPTELVWYRNMNPVSFEKQENDKILKIRTKYFELTYLKNKDFLGSKVNPVSHLKVELLNTDRVWYYQHPEVRNYGAPSFSLENQNGENKNSKGLYSVDGFVSIDDSTHMIFTKNGNLESRTVECKDIYLFMYFRDFALCLKDYFMITSYPNLIPRYAFGNWWSKNSLYHDSDIQKIVENFETHQIPLSVFLLDQAWYVTDDKNHTGFTWNPDLFSQPVSLSNFLHSKNIRLALRINPSNGFQSYEKNFPILANYLYPDESGTIPFHALDPRNIDAYLKILIHPLEQQGTDFFLLDEDDPKKSSTLFSLSHYHFLDTALNHSKRPLILSRNFEIAPHRYPILYSGRTIVSWETLKKVVSCNGSASHLGISYFAHDIGGYHLGTEDSELYIRFLQLATFSSILKFGSSDGKYYKREPWNLGTKAYNISKTYLALRHKMIPYLYSESYKYSKYGMPLIMPIYYSNPKMYDDIYYRNEYSFGTELFVCPITQKKDDLIHRVIHKFYLPEGTWYDFVTGKKFIGDRKHLSFFKDENYPVFARSGSIIPLNGDPKLNDTAIPTNLEIQIFPGKTNQYKLYEDDGTTMLYQLGHYLLTSIEYNYLPNNYTVIIRPLEGKKGIIPDYRNYKIVFRNTKKADQVITYFNDNPIPNRSYIKDNNFVVELENISTMGQITINCKGKNIEIDAVRIVSDDIESIISDLSIPTKLKEEIDSIFFSSIPIKTKRIEIRKLTNKGLEKNFVQLFLKLLEYIDQIYR